jgi:hypothetical protein
MKTLHELADHGECMWIVSDEGVKPALYCGEATGDIFLRYCPTHRKAGTQPPRPIQRSSFVKLGRR